MSDVLDEYDVRSIAVAWYTPATWRELCALPEAKIEISYSRYLRNVKRMMADFAARGLRPVRVLIDVGQMVEWCHRHGYAVDTRGRTVFGSVLSCLAPGEDIMPKPFEDRTRMVR